MFNTGYNGIIGLLILIGDVWAIINIFQSSASIEKKVVGPGIVITFVFPEPASASLVLASLGGLLMRRRNRNA